MVFSEVLEQLQRQGLAVTPTQLRWAITSGKVLKPVLDGALRFDFGESNLVELVDYFRVKGSKSKKGSRGTRRQRKEAA